MKRNVLGTVTYYLEERDLDFDIDYNLEDLIAYLRYNNFNFRPHQNGQFEIQRETIEELIDFDLINLEVLESEDEFKEICWNRHEDEFDY